MINSKFVKTLWVHRQDHIHISRTLFNETETEYLCKVLDKCNFTGTDYISTHDLCRTVKQNIKAGKTWQETSKELLEQNQFLESIA